MNIRAIALWIGAVAAVAAIVPLASYDRSQAATAITSGKENTSILVQNVGNAPAEFVAEYYNPDGSLIAAATDPESGVAPGSTRNFAQAENANLPVGYRGLAIINSDQPINTLLVRDILDVLSKHSYSIAGAYGSGGHKLAIPLAFNELLSGGSWNSRISVVNTGSTVACLRMTYLVVATGDGSATTNQTFTDNGTGGTGCATGYRLPAGGQLTFGRTGTGVIQFPVSTQNNQMAVLVEVLTPGDNAITANVDLYQSEGNRLFGSYNAFITNDAAPTTDDVGSDIIIPVGIKDASGFYSVIAMQILDGVTTNVAINYVGIDIDNGNAPVNVTTNLNGVKDVASRSIYSETAVPQGFVGYARVTASGGAKLAAVLIRGKQTFYFSGVTEATYTAVNGVPADRADTAWNLPLVFRRFSDALYNSWIQVQVANGGSAQVTLTFTGDPAQGCPVGPYTSTHTVNGSKVFYMNSSDAADHGFGNAPPSCFLGGARVTANADVVVISNGTTDFYPNSDNDGLYNAFPAE
ncbi:MAG: hypothetical protein ACSLFM_09010 [Tepidiformaceae bacterium]